MFVLKSYAVKKQSWITIFIHGSVGLRANVNLNTFRRLVRDCVTGSLYEKNVSTIRQNPFLYTMQPMQEYGLKAISKYNSIHSGPYAFANIYNYMLKKHIDNNSRNKFYTFGWSGLISKKQRYKEARILYVQLKKELARLSQKGIIPKIRIVAYSHGASLAYNLATLRKTEFPRDQFVINEMTSIGTPIFSSTKNLICHPIFKKVYHFYSESDSIQKLDIFSGNSPFSHRSFHGPLPNKLKQIEIKLTEKICQPKCWFSKWQKNCINHSPGHVELWFFGWALRGYRQDFILNPLPTAILIPYLQQLADNNTLGTNNLTIDLKPKNNYVCITKKQYSAGCPGICLPFLEPNEFEYLKAKALKFHPERPKYIDSYNRMQSNFNCNLYK